MSDLWRASMRYAADGVPARGRREVFVGTRDAVNEVAALVYSKGGDRLCPYEQSPSSPRTSATVDEDSLRAGAGFAGLLFGTPFSTVARHTGSAEAPYVMGR